MTTTESKIYTYRDKNGNLKLDIETLIRDIIDEYEFICLPDTEEVLVFDNGYWRFGGEAAIKAEAEHRVGICPQLTTHNINEIIGHIQRSTYTARKLLNQTPKIINIMNGLLDVRTRELKPHTPKFLSTIRIPVTYDPNAACPRITQFFSEVLQPQDVPVIEELFGYCLIPDYSIQRAFLFVGDGANGKSTLLNLLKTFIGQDNVSNVPWHALELDRFAKSALEGKLVNMFADIPSQGLSFTGSFKMLTGGDSIGTEKKFRDYFSFINFARLVFSSNKPPKIYQEDSYAFWRRWVILSFPHQFTGENEDKRLLAKLTTGEELSGLLNIALDGLDRLLKNQGYSYAKSVEETTEIYLRVSDPVYAFVQDCCELDSEASIAKEALYDVFKGYCKLKSTPLIKANAFARQLQNQTHFKVRSGRETVDKKQVTIWQGLKFSEVSEDSEVISSITAYKQNSTVNKIYRENPANPANPTKNLSDNIPGYPTVPCPVCGSIDYWLTDDNRWLCERCHPNPNKEVS